MAKKIDAEVIELLAFSITELTETLNRIGKTTGAGVVSPGSGVTGQITGTKSLGGVPAGTAGLFKGFSKVLGAIGIIISTVKAIIPESFAGAFQHQIQEPLKMTEQYAREMYGERGAEFTPQVMQDIRDFHALAVKRERGISKSLSAANQVGGLVPWAQYYTTAEEGATYWREKMAELRSWLDSNEKVHSNNKAEGK